MPPRPERAPSRRHPFAVVLLVLAVALAACGSGSDVVRWRDVRLSPPLGWVVNENEGAVLGLANAEVEGPGDRGARLVYVQFTHEPGSVPDDWREFVQEQDGVLEIDEAIEVDQVPATRLVFAFTTNGVDTREMVVLIPSREVVILFQPVVQQGETDGPDRFVEYRETFDSILAGIDFGAPV